MLKKILTFAVVLVLLLNMIPLESLAEILSGLEYDRIIAEARRVDAEEETVSSDFEANASATAYEIWALLDRFMLTDVQYALNLHTQLEENSAAVNGNEADSLLDGTEWLDFVELWSLVDYNRFGIDSARSNIRHYLYVIDSEDATEADKQIAYVKLRDALTTIAQVKLEVEENLDDWKEFIQQFIGRIMLFTESDAVNDMQSQLDMERQKESDSIAETVEVSLGNTNESIKILVLNKNQIGLNVRDENQNPIKGATFTLTSVEKPGISSSGVTNENGAVAVDISKFPLNDDGLIFVNALLTADGRRTWRSDGRVVEGGKALVKDLVMKKDDGSPYIQGVSLRGTDVLYHSDTLYITEKNNKEHNLIVYIDPNGKSGQMVVGFNENGQSNGMTLSFDAQTKALEFKRKWCAALTIGSSIDLQMSVDHWIIEHATLSVTVAKAVIPEPSTQTLDVFGADSLFPGFLTTLNWHDKPWFNNLSFMLDIPFEHLKWLARNITITPDGAYSFGINVSITTSLVDDQDFWKVKTNEIASLYERNACKASDVIKKMQEGGVMKTRADGKVGTVADASLDFGIEAVLHGFATNVKNSQGSKLFKSNATIAFMIKFFSTYTRYLLAWVIPVHAGVDFGVNVTAGLQWKSSYYGNNIIEALNLKKFIQNSTWPRVVISLVPQLYIYAGIGVRGVCGITLTGMFNFVFTFLLEKTGDAGFFKLLGDLSIIGSFFFITAAQSIITGNIVDEKRLFDNRRETVENEESSALASVIGPEDATVVTTGKGVGLSPLLTVSTTETDLSTELVDAMDSIATPSGLIYLYRDGSNRQRIGWTGNDGIITGDKTALLEDMVKDYNDKDYYIYSTHFISCGDKAILCAAMAKYSENVKDSFKNKGKRYRYVKPGGTYFGLAEFRIKNGKLICLCSKMEGTNDNYFPGNVFGSMDGVIFRSDELTSSNHVLVTCYDPVTLEIICLYVYESGDNFIVIHDKDFVNLKTDLQGVRYQVESISQVFATNFNWSKDKSGFYCIFTDDRKKEKHLLCMTANLDGENSRTQRILDINNMECMTTIYHNSSIEIPDDVFFITEPDGSGKYNLVGYRALWSDEDQILKIYRESELSLKIPNPQIQCARTLGLNTLYWVEAAAQYTDEDPKNSQYQVRCCYVPLSGRTMITQPSTLLGFDSDAYDPEDISLSNLKMINGPWGYGGMVEKVAGENAKKTNAAENDVVSFNLKQVLDAQITGSMVNTPVISQGEPVTVLFRIENKGNVPLKAANIKIQDQKNPKQYEMVYIDFESPEQSTAAMYENGTVLEMNGLTAVTEYEGFATTEDRYVYVKNADGSTEMVEYSLLLPGQTRLYRAVFCIPSNWGYQSERILECTVTDYVVNAVLDSETNQYSAAAAFFSGAQITDVETGETTEYVTNDEIQEIWFSVETGEVTKSVPKNAKSKLMKLTATKGTGCDTFEVAPAANGTALISMPDPILFLEGSYSMRNGEREILINIENTASIGIKELTVCSYLDGSEEETAMLTLTPDYTLKHTHTLNFIIPERELTKGVPTDVLQLMVTGVTEDGAAIENDNICYIRLDEVLGVVEQPQDVILYALPGTATYQLEAYGVGALTYQWQESHDQGKTWTNLAGETSDRLTVQVQVNQYGDDYDTKARYRCVITDTAGQTVTSEPAALYLQLVPETGDSARITLYLTLAMLSLCAAAILLLLKRKRGHC